MSLRSLAFYQGKHRILQGPDPLPPGQVWEERLQRAREVSSKEGDSVRHEATNVVLEAMGENQAAMYRADGMLDVPLDVAKRLADRAGLKEPVESLHPYAFVDRNGLLHLPYLGAERLARALASTEPENVLRGIENHELRLKSEGYEPGNRYLHDLLRDYQPGFALARQWSGFEKEVQQLRGEIERLRVLVRGAVSALIAAGDERALLDVLSAHSMGADSCRSRSIRGGSENGAGARRSDARRRVL